MSRMTLSLVVSAQDQTQAALRSAMGSLSSFSRAAAKGITVPLRIGAAGLGVLRDIHLGLRPALGAIDSLIERGSRLELVQKAFGGLARLGAADVDVLGRRLQAASGHTLRLADAMRMANRGMSLGLDMRTIVTATEFASRKAAELGEDSSGLLERILLDLGKGTTRVLDDIGLMRDGVEGVAAAYDRIHGSRAFVGLSESAQKAEIARAAVAEMARDMRGMRVTLADVGSGWTRLKTAVGDAMDQMVRTVVGSPAMREIMGGLGEMVGRVQQHFQSGGTFGQLMRGRDGSGGLLGIARGAMTDIGAAIGRGASAAFEWMREVLPAAIERLRGLAADVMAQLAAWRDALVERLARLLEPLGAVLNRIVDAANRLLGALPKPVQAAVRGLPTAASATVADPVGALRQTGRALWAVGAGLWELPGDLSLWDADQRDARMQAHRELFRRRLGNPYPATQPASAAGVGWMPGLGVVPVGPMVAAAAVMGGAAAEAVGSFRHEFPWETDAGRRGDDLMQWMADRDALRGRMLLRPQARRNMQEAERRRATRELNMLEGRSSEGLRLRGEAWREAQARAAAAARAGYQVTDTDRSRFYAEALFKREQASLAQSGATGERAQSELRLDSTMRQMLAQTQALMQQVSALVAVLGGEERAIARAAG